jgi:hypothetical protein
MAELFLYLFLLLCFGLMAKIVIRPSLIFEFPYFVAGIFLIFIVPQTIIISNNPQIIPKDTFFPLMLSCFLCLLMAYIGYYYAPTIKVGKALNASLNLNRLRNIAILYTGLGYLFTILIRRTYADMESSGVDIPTQATGIVTIYFQFSQLLNVAFPILLFLAFTKPNFSNISLSIIAGFPTLYSIITAGRREPTAFFFLTIAFAAFYIYKMKPPRIAIVGVIIMAMLIIPATADYRAKAKKEGSLAALQSVDLRQSFINYFNEDGTYLELNVAAHVIDAYSFRGEFQYGRGYWDQMVFRYVPAQIVGDRTKRVMQLSETVPYRNGYSMPLGLTLTGIGDSFAQFGYLGCIFFFFLGGFFRTLWNTSLNTDNLLIRSFYIVCVIQALLTVTHATINFIPGVFFYFLFLWLAAVYAREKVL